MLRQSYNKASKQPGAEVVGDESRFFPEDLTGVEPAPALGEAVVVAVA